jgi:hypothetical protein
VSKRHIKTDGLSLADVVEMKNIAFEWERQDAIGEAENDFGYTVRWPLMAAPIPAVGPVLTEADRKALIKEMILDSPGATGGWDEVISVPGATTEEKAVHLAARKAQIPSHVWPKLLLDLVVDLIPPLEPLPKTLIALLQDELGLPKNHEVGFWPTTAGMRDDRGGRDHEARNCASDIDLNHLDPLLTHKDKTIRSDAKPMPLNELQRKVKAKLGRAPDRKTLREWRENLDYWNLTQRHRQAQLRAAGK